MKIEKKVKNKIHHYVISNYEKLDPSQFDLGEINYTHRCHLNAVQKVREGKAEKVYSCVAVDKDNKDVIIVHFINQTKDGKFIDHTWGWMKEHYDYYLIKEIKENEQNNIWRILSSTKEFLFELNSTWFESLFCNKEII